LKKFLCVTLILLCAFSIFAESKGSGASIGFGYQLSNAKAAKTTYQQLVEGDEISSTNELMLDIHGWSVLNQFLRLGGVISGGYFDAKGEPTTTADVEEDESGVGFGDARVAVMPEVFVNFGPINTAMGVAFGGGSIITFINDDNGDNDGEMFFYGFMRPQVTGAFDLGPLGVQVGAGYHLPLAGSDGEFWYIDEDDDTVSNEFEISEMSGFFVKMDIFFGSKTVEE